MFSYYYEYILSEENGDNSLPPNINNLADKDIDLLIDKINNDLPANEHGSFFRTSSYNKPVITDEKQAKKQLLKFVIQHKKEDGSFIEMDKSKLATRVREYRIRVNDKIIEIQKKGYTPNRGKELSNRFHKLDYWVRKQNDLMNVYDQNLKVV